MQILIFKDNQQLGPFDMDGLRDGVSRGVFTPDDLAWQDGCPQWVRLSELVDVQELGTPTSITGVIAEQLSQVDTVSTRLLSDGQDPALVQKIYSRVREMLTRDEVVEYLGIQKKPLVTISPDAIVLTNRRFMIVRFKLMGMAFEDYLWREVGNVHMSEQMLGATITCTAVTGQKIKIDSLPKAQARRIYTYAQEIEEQMHVARHRTELDRLRAGAGGVVIQAPTTGEVSPTSPQSLESDPLAILSKLKKMLEAGLIEQSEYDAKKREVLSRM